MVFLLFNYDILLTSKKSKGKSWYIEIKTILGLNALLYSLLKFSIFVRQQLKMLLLKDECMYIFDTYTYPSSMKLWTFCVDNTKVALLWNSALIAQCVNEPFDKFITFWL